MRNRKVTDKVQIIQINLVLKNLFKCAVLVLNSSNNTNKLSPQELIKDVFEGISVQIIQINLVLKNFNLSINYMSEFK